jgi:3',5'-nucleoside bisphosphate phosphatase
MAHPLSRSAELMKEGYTGKMKIDLHIHTNYSDGLNTPEEVAELAHKGGLDVISVTEHDRVDSTARVQQACAPFNIRVVPGVEISTNFNKKTLHVLGYNIDVENKELLAFFQKINDSRREKFIEKFPILNEALKQAGLPEADIEKYKEKKDGKYYSHPGLWSFLCEEGIIKDRQEGPQYTKDIRGTAPFIEPKDAFEVVHSAGGVAVLSHPFAPKISLKILNQEKQDQEAVIAELKGQGLDGLECYQAAHDPADVAFCLQMADKYDLIITAGSDWHGYYPPEEGGIREYTPFYVSALGDLDVPEEAAERILKGLKLG